ncbi:MAG: VOC family protein [Pseudomonadota bacterium]
MNAPVKAVPDGYTTITPYLIVRGARRALEFYQKAFGATPRLCLPGAGGGIAHAELAIGSSVVMLADEFPGLDARCPHSLGGSPVSLLIYVDDVDATYAQALAAGATALRPLENRFYGDRAGQVCDPFGHIWTLASRVEAITAEQLAGRLEEMFGSIVPT